MEEYTKKVRLSFDVDESSRQNIEATLDALSKQGLDLNGLDEKSISSLRELASAVKTLNIESIQNDSDDEDEQERNKENLELDKIISDNLQSLLAGFSLNTSLILTRLKSFFDSVLEKADELQDASKLTNESVRNLRLTYGLTAGEAYGVNNALDLLNIQDLTDLVYADEWQKEKFVELMNKYSEMYNNAYDADLYNSFEEMQIDLAMLKDELQLKFLSFVTDNADLFTKAMTAIISIMDFLLGTDESEQEEVETIDMFTMDIPDANIMQTPNLYINHETDSGFEADSKKDESAKLPEFNIDNDALQNIAKMSEKNVQPIESSEFVNNMNTANISITTNNTFNNANENTSKLASEIDKKYAGQYEQVVKALGRRA